jgi:predicted porin
MKKTLIALAAVAATGAAFAQSSVTLSGTVDTGIQKTASGAPLSMVASRSGTSNWTVSGTEDLGSGLKAIFKVSTAFNSDDGTSALVGTAPNQSGVLGNNDMFVGLTGGFGSIKLGRSFDIAFSNALTANSTKGVTGYSTRAGTLDSNGVYISNQLLYTSPSMGGVTASIQYAPSEATGVKATTGLGVAYGNGPIAATYAYSKILGGNALNQIAGSYDFGAAKVLLTFTDRAKVASDADSSYALGVTAPVGPGMIWASYDKRESSDTKVIHGGYKYFLSKRTTVYLNLGNKKVASAKATNGYGLGVQHNF